ncbi:hypothetical protein FHR34_002165 [Kitasatospora kifunensis]|uniref:Uncharacterized protein n=1 Tax=Kitasatospora kifunensis TaxID=58351 RepID=A0A7W7VUD0_KITKI|nr:hypothetical protein [Kitasatospora kifunensis]
MQAFHEADRTQRPDLPPEQLRTCG